MQFVQDINTIASEGAIHSFTIWSDWVTSLLMVGFFVGFFYILRLIIKRKVFIALYASFSATIFIVWIFSLYTLCFLFSIGLVVIVLAYLYANVGELRAFTSNSLQVKKEFNSVFSHSKQEVQKIFDHDKLYEDITTAVQYFSTHKTGALITFERKVGFNDIVKSGTAINAPVSPELLETIFYEGTRLHDGAVVIRGNTIIAAAVYYTPTEKALTGKYGSRHRAAIGISEVTDSVTVVVSEETGRISFAIGGELIRVYPDKFNEQLKDYLEQDNASDEEDNSNEISE